MSREEAHTLLNAAKAGRPTPERVIVEALIATGDFSRNEAPLVPLTVETLGAA